MKVSIGFNNTVDDSSFPCSRSTRQDEDLAL